MALSKIVLPAQRVEWDIKIEAPHDIKIGRLMHLVEREIEKGARGERKVCFVERDFNWNLITGWQWYDVFTTFLFTLDIFLNFFTGYQLNTGECGQAQSSRKARHVDSPRTTSHTATYF